MEGTGRLSLPFLMGFNSIYLGVNYLWISFESLILPTEIGGIVPVGQMGLYLGVIAAVGAGSGIAGNLGSGFLGDRIHIGGARRYPYIAIGIGMTVVAVLLEHFISLSVYVITAGYVLLQVFSNVAIGSVQPVVAETVRSEQRGVSAGMNGLFTLTGSAMGFGITGYLMTYHTEATAIYAIAGGVAFTGIASILTLALGRVPVARAEHLHISSFRHIPPDMRSFQRLISGSFMVFMGITGLTYFELYFFRQVLLVSNPQLYVAIAGIVVLAISAVASIVLGHFSDRIGRWRILILDSAFAAIPTAMIPYFRSFYVFLILGAFIGSAYGTFYSVSSAMAGDLAPKNEAGKYMAFFNLSLAGASTISPLIYGALLFIFRNTVHTGYIALFSASSAFYLMGAFIILMASRVSGSIGHRNAA